MTLEQIARSQAGMTVPENGWVVWAPQVSAPVFVNPRLEDLATTVWRLVRDVQVQYPGVEPKVEVYELGRKVVVGIDPVVVRLEPVTE